MHTPVAQLKVSAYTFGTNRKNTTKINAVNFFMGNSPFNEIRSFEFRTPNTGLEGREVLILRIFSSNGLHFVVQISIVLRLPSMLYFLNAPLVTIFCTRLPTQNMKIGRFMYTCAIVNKSRATKCQDFVHYVVCWSNPLKVKLNSGRAWDVVIPY